VLSVFEHSLDLLHQHVWINLQHTANFNELNDIYPALAALYLGDEGLGATEFFCQLQLG
jgi:hypothetical protein